MFTERLRKRPPNRAAQKGQAALPRGSTKIGDRCGLRRVVAVFNTQRRPDDYDKKKRVAPHKNGAAPIQTNL